MLYQTYQFNDDLVAPMRLLAQTMNTMMDSVFGTVGQTARRQLSASLEMVCRFEITHERPDFAIDSVPVGNRIVPVTTDVALDLPFGQLLRFSKDIETPQPKVLVV